MANVEIAVSVNFSPVVDHLRRNSTGSLCISSNEANDMPNYLRASAGSCHDFCKYGIKREFKITTRIPMPKRIPVSANKGLKPAKSENLQKMKISMPPSNAKSSIFQAKDKEMKQLAEKESKTSNRGYSDNLSKEAKGRGIWNYGINANKSTQTSKGDKKVNSVHESGSRSNCKDAIKVLKEVSHLKNQGSFTKTKSWRASIENIPEKILHVTEETSGGYAIPGSSMLLPEETEDVSYTDKSSLFPLFSPSSAAEADCSPEKSKGGKLLDENETGNAEANIDCESIKVVLRHKNEAEERPNKSLYNHVIEETARKLVLKRKSKVMALVGAFETVISLVDKKASDSMRR